jgi:Family of unknown function (DUF6187)
MPSDAVPQRYTCFTLPSINDPPMIETGVILMGLAAERLLAGLGMAALNDDPALVALAVDQFGHGAAPWPTADAMLAAGTNRWHATRAALAAASQGAPATGSARQSWSHALRTVSAVDPAELRDAGPATRAYLAACWLRRDEIDRCIAARRPPTKGSLR